MVVERLFLTVPRGCLQFVIVVFPDHTHLLFLLELSRICDYIKVLCNGYFVGVQKTAKRPVI